MANHKRLYAVVKYLCEKANDPNAEFIFDVSPADATDAAGNRIVSIQIKSRIPPAAAEAILRGFDDDRTLFGYGPIKESSTGKGKQ